MKLARHGLECGALLRGAIASACSAWKALGHRCVRSPASRAPLALCHSNRWDMFFSCSVE
eukprot:7271274-Pyramimonas_sp.AAC.1